MSMKEGLILYRYTITFAKSFKKNGEEFADPKGPKLKQIIRLMLNSQDFANRRKSIVTDFQLNLVSLEELPEDIRNQKVNYFHEADGAAQPNAQTYNLHIVPLIESGDLRISDLMAFLTSTTTTTQYPAKTAMVQALNTLIGHQSVSNPTTTVIGGKRAFPSDAASSALGGALIARRGFFSSVRLASHRTLVNVNISHGAFYSATELTVLMEDCGVKSFNHPDQWQALETLVKGLKVKTKYLRGANGEQITMIKTISGFAHEEDRYGQDPQPKPKNGFAESPVRVFFHLKDAAEFATLTSGRSRIHRPGSIGYENRQNWRTVSDRGPGFLSVAEFFGESALWPCIYSLRLLTPHRTRCLD